MSTPANELWGASYCVVELNRGVTYYAVWNDVRADDAKACVERLAEAYQRGALRIVADFSRVTHVRAETLSAIDPIVARLAAHNFGARTLLVRPRAAAGLALVGFFTAYLAPHEFLLVDSPLVPQRHLPLDDALDRLASLTARVDQRLAIDAPLLVLRQLFRDEGMRLTLAAAAKRLHMAARSLERRLHDADTSFRNERDLAREAAWRDMRHEHGVSIKAVADALGFSSPRQLARWSQRRLAKTPREIQTMAQGSTTPTS
ncbi:MAG: AraC family transcriptional regulator [Deltaproteobacteria bacterium]|nr:AraC family transcriptional regulator [Deltaproteobacteria bacterium]